MPRRGRFNDTDAAGIAEAHYGVADHPGTVLVLTFGTGIGSAVLRGGKLEPNTEFGQLLVDGHIADRYVSLSARLADRLSWPSWIGRANRFLRVVEEQEEFDLIVIGGGITHETLPGGTVRRPGSARAGPILQHGGCGRCGDGGRARHRRRVPPWPGAAPLVMEHAAT